MPSPSDSKKQLVSVQVLDTPLLNTAVLILEMARWKKHGWSPPWGKLTVGESPNYCASAELAGELMDNIGISVWQTADSTLPEWAAVVSIGTWKDPHKPVRECAYGHTWKVAVARAYVLNSYPQGVNVSVLFESMSSPQLIAPKP